jgi:uncharacterized membrane protein YdfJ with MMPL/SSD domain
MGRILGGYLAACLTSAVAVGVVLGFLTEIQSIRSEWRILTTFSDTIGLTVYIAPVILSLTFLPAILFILQPIGKLPLRFPPEPEHVVRNHRPLCLRDLGHKVKERRIYWKTQARSLC